MVGYKIIFDMADKNNRISFLNFPSLEKISEGNHSLKLINTINVIPNHLRLTIWTFLSPHPSSKTLWESEFLAFRQQLTQ